MAKFDGGTRPGVHHRWAGPNRREALRLRGPAQQASTSGCTSVPVETRICLAYQVIPSEHTGRRCRCSPLEPVARKRPRATLHVAMQLSRLSSAIDALDPDGQRPRRDRTVRCTTRCLTLDCKIGRRRAPRRNSHSGSVSGCLGAGGRHAARRSCSRFSGARPDWRARWHRARPWRRIGVARSTLHPSVSRLTGQEAADCDRGQDRDRDRIDKCGLV
jgi:hypothetical protein